MFKNHFSAILGIAAVFAVAAMPADAADDIEVAAQVCSACHGEHGEPQDKTTPIIWGQQQSYGVKQLHDYKSGDRANPIMSPMAEGTGRSSQDGSLFCSQELAGEASQPCSCIPAQRHRDLLGVPSKEFRGWLVGTAACRAKLRIPARLYA